MQNILNLEHAQCNVEAIVNCTVYYSVMYSAMCNVLQLHRRSDTGFGILDKIGTFLGPFWDLSGTFCRYFHENYRKTYTRLKRL